MPMNSVVLPMCTIEPTSERLQAMSTPPCGSLPLSISTKVEPLCNDESQQEREHSTSEDSDIDESSQAQDRLVNTDW